MKPHRFLSLFAAGCLLLLAACGTSPQAEELPPESPPVQNQPSIVTPVNIPFQLAVYPAYTLHPTYAENRANLVLGTLLYEPLFALDEHFQPHPLLCQSYQISEDGLTWTLTLQPQVTFSDETPLTGSLVADTLNLARQPDSRYSTRLTDIVSITGTEQTVVLTLRQPNSSLPALLDIPIALGQDSRPLGTGGYVLTIHEDTWSLNARSDWWQNKSLPVQKIPLTPVRKSDDLVFSFGSGDVSLVDVDLMSTNSLGYSGSYESWDYPTTSMLYLGFQTGRGLCRSASVRQALAHAIDRASIAQVDFAQHAVPSALPIHPNSPLYDTALAEELAYDPEQLVTQLNQLHLIGRTLTLLVNSENTAKVSAAQRIADQLNAAGMDVTVKKVSFEDYTAALKKGNFDLYLGEVVLTADFNLEQLLLPNGSLCYSEWGEPTAYELLFALRTAQEESQRIQAAQALYQSLKEQVPIVPICFKNGSVLTRWGQLSGLQPVRGNVFYRLEEWTIQGISPEGDSLSISEQTDVEN